MKNTSVSNMKIVIYHSIFINIIHDDNNNHLLEIYDITIHIKSVSIDYYICIFLNTDCKHYSGFNFK